MVQKLYGGAKYQIMLGLVDRWIEVVKTDDELAKRVKKPCPCQSDALVKELNQRTLDYIIEAVGILGTTFGQDYFNMDNLRKMVADRRNNVTPTLAKR